MSTLVLLLIFILHILWNKKIRENSIIRKIRLCLPKKKQVSKKVQCTFYIAGVVKKLFPLIIYFYQNEITKFHYYCTPTARE